MPDRPHLWHTDRSAIYTSCGRCPRQRWLNRHFGPTGYGIVRKAESLPLATGTYTHKATEHLQKYLLLHDDLPPAAVVREAIQIASDAYIQKIEARGYRGLLGGEDVEEVIQEQICLIAGMIWNLADAILPWLHTEFRVIAVEEENTYVLGCTCGLPPTVEEAAHAAKGCTGIALQLRQDCLAQRRAGGNLAYFETKTTGSQADQWSAQWETKPQFGLGTLGTLERIGKEVTELYVLGLYKGFRQKAKDGSGKTSQASPFCWGYCRPGNPPLATDDWLGSYEWIDEVTGQTRRASKAHQKRGLWELETSDWEPWQQAQASGFTPMEFWTRALPKSVREKQIFLVGPMNRQDWQIPKLRRQILASEQEWQAKVWAVYEKQTALDLAFNDPKLQEKLDQEVPCSWDCRRFGERHECEFVPICHEQAGWEDPLGTGKFVPRRPHHKPELAIAIERGLLPEHAEDEEDEEE